MGEAFSPESMQHQQKWGNREGFVLCSISSHAMQESGTGKTYADAVSEDAGVRNVPRATYLRPFLRCVLGCRQLRTIFQHLANFTTSSKI